MRIPVFSKSVALLTLLILLPIWDVPVQALSANSSSVEILTDLPPVQMDIFSKKMMPEIIARTKERWFKLIPEEARTPRLERAKVMIQFSLHPDGTVSKMMLVFPSGHVPLDRAAWTAITGASPFPAFPPQIKTEEIKIRFDFFYNDDATAPAKSN
jgi:TonB family protein